MALCGQPGLFSPRHRKDDAANESCEGLAGMADQKSGIEQNGTDSLLVPAGDPVIRTIAMPADTNPAGDIFGGWIMSQMDLAAGNAAARLSRGRCATVAVEGMTFHSPVKVG